MLAMLIMGTIITVAGLIVIIVIIAKLIPYMANPNRMRAQDKKTQVIILCVGGFLVVLGIILSVIFIAIK